MKENCKHKWGLVLVQYRNKILTSSARMCVKCGFLKIGSHTIKLSRNRLDMDQKPIQNVSRIDISSRLKIPVGTNLYD
ncbi:MAG: hypothetical protein Q8N87_02160 [bacterium]|nr:hypothetical protein [bacterium]